MLLERATMAILDDLQVVKELVATAFGKHLLDGFDYFLKVVFLCWPCRGTELAQAVVLIVRVLNIHIIFS